MSLRFASIAWELRWLRPINLLVAFSYETRGMLDICDGILEVFPWPAMLLVCDHRPPPLRGTWLFHHHGFVVTIDRCGDDSVHGGSLTS